MLNFQHKNGCKGHQQSNLEWHVLYQKLMSPGVLLFMLKISETAQDWYYATPLLVTLYAFLLRFEVNFSNNTQIFHRKLYYICVPTYCKVLILQPF